MSKNIGKSSDNSSENDCNNVCNISHHRASRVRKTGALLLGLLLCLSLAVTTGHQVFLAHLNRADEQISRLVTLPEGLVKLATMEFSGPASDLLMFKIMVYLGEKLERQENPAPQEWQLAHQAICQVTNLDERFWDPYLLAMTTFPWDAPQLLPQTVGLLEKAALARPEDHQPYYFLWFLHAYFLDDARQAAHYIRLAAEKLGAPSYYPSLAARSALYAGNPMAGALFLEGLSGQTNSPELRQYYAKRIDALKKIAFLQEKVDAFTSRFGFAPTRLEQLREQGFVSALPEDPYGGQFFIDAQTRVYTTSKLVEAKQAKKEASEQAH